jgi:hypothetical protein
MKKYFITSLLEKYKVTNPNIPESVFLYYINVFDKWFKESKKNNKKDILQYTFNELKDIIDLYYPTKKTKQSYIIYSDDNIILYKGIDMNSCITLLEGYTGCIARKYDGNSYPGRRLAPATFYFCENKINKKYFVIEVKNFSIEVTEPKENNFGVKPNYTFYSKKDIVLQYPELQQPYINNLLVVDPLTAEESKKLYFFDFLSKQFDTNIWKELQYYQKQEYINAKFKLPDDIVISMDKVLRKDYLLRAHDFFNIKTFNTLSVNEKKIWVKARLKLNDASIVNTALTLMLNGYHFDLTTVNNLTWVDIINKEFNSSYTFRDKQLTVL